eukprot:14743479-Heterocapsa_arctica.AAC.1
MRRRARGPPRPRRGTAPGRYEAARAVFRAVGAGRLAAAAQRGRSDVLAGERESSRVRACR